jgi:5'-phosphate synthase pdxT subunit
MSAAKKVGVLAVQGAFAEHVNRLREMGHEPFEIRQARDLDREIDALVLPGGESTTQAKLINDLALREPLAALIGAGLPTLGTCAGLILLADKVDAASEAKFGEGRARLDTFPMKAARNAYGRQLGSFHASSAIKIGSAHKDIPMTFIRAPYIAELGEGGVELARVDGRLVAAAYKNQIACAFHPELDDDNTIYELLLGGIDLDSQETMHQEQSKVNATQYATLQLAG